MLTTEFILYLIIVAFVVFIAVNYWYYNANEPEIQYRYIPIYTSPKTDSEQKKTDSTSMVPYNPDAGNDNENDGIVNIDIRKKYIIDPTSGRRVLAPMRDPLRDFDVKAINDPFTPPFRRPMYDDYPLLPALMPYYTRPQGRFRKVGVLISNDDVEATDPYKFLMLMGRQKYPGREYEYYAMSSNAEYGLKFYIETNGKEISNGDDSVEIVELDRTFTFKEDPDLSPRYDPYIL